MADKFVAEMVSVDTAVRQAYTDLAAIRKELDERLSRCSPARGDNRDRTYVTWRVVEDLGKINTPDLSAVSGEILSKEVCVTLNTGSKSRENRKNNALAKLRPVVVVLRKAQFLGEAEQISRDLERLDYMEYIRGAYDRS